MSSDQMWTLAFIVGILVVIGLIVETAENAWNNRIKPNLPQEKSKAKLARIDDLLNQGNIVAEWINTNATHTPSLQAKKTMSEMFKINSYIEELEEVNNKDELLTDLIYLYKYTLTVRYQFAREEGLMIDTTVAPDSDVAKLALLSEEDLLIRYKRAIREIHRIYGKYL